MSPSRILPVLLALALVASLGWGLSLRHRVDQLEGELASQPANRHEADRSDLRRARHRAQQSGTGAEAPAATPGDGPPARRLSRPVTEKQVREELQDELRGAASTEEADAMVAARLKEVRLQRAEERQARARAAVDAYAEEADLDEATTTAVHDVLDETFERMTSVRERVASGELPREHARAEVEAAREQARDDLVEILGEKGAQDLRDELFRGPFDGGG